MIKFKSNKNKKSKNKFQRGVSILTLVITIVVIIILAAIALRATNNSLEEAAVADFKQELKGIEVSVSSERVANQKERNRRRI